MSAAPVEEPVVDVLVVDDSQVMRMVLVHLLESDPRFRVVGAVDDGAAALEFVQRTPPHVVLMDIHMRGMDGFEVTRRIMESRPVPIVLCSAISDPREVATAFRAIEVGAVAVVAKPVAPTHPDFARMASDLLGMVRLMSEVRVVRRWGRKPAPVSRPPRPAPSAPIALVGIGASTGGPPALQAILSALPASLDAAVLVVQHITAGFLPGLAEWLTQTSGLRVQIAGFGMQPRPGHVYLAPDDYHLGIGSDGLLRLSHDVPENGLRPSVDHLFHSLATHRPGSSLGVLLTGMGRDGARGLLALREGGAPTIAQDRQSSIVHGMPGAAIELGAAAEILPVDRIADAICRQLRMRKEERND